MLVVSKIKYYKNISYPTWFPYCRSTAFPTQIFQVLLMIPMSGSQVEIMRVRLTPTSVSDA
jgi:hypothetical protein